MMQRLTARHQPQSRAAAAGAAARPSPVLSWPAARAAPAPATVAAVASEEGRLPAAAVVCAAPASPTVAVASAARTTATALLAAAALLLTGPSPEAHAGLFPDRGAAARERLEQADRTFEQSGTLKALLERSEQNRDKNRRAIAAKTCARQAELGIGDCGGLKYVPGATQNGAQKTPEFLSKLLGTEGKEIPYEASGKTLAELLAADEARAVAREAEAAAAASGKQGKGAVGAVEAALEAVTSAEEAP